jgi:hypothetical protein
VTTFLVSNTVDTHQTGSYQAIYTLFQDFFHRTTNATITLPVTCSSETVQVSDSISVKTNGQYIRVFSGTTKISQKKISKKKFKKNHFILQVKKLYPKKSYTTVFFLGTRKHQATLVAVRLTKNNTLVKKQVVRFAITKNTPLKLRFKIKKKQIIAQVGPKQHRTKQLFTLKKNGALKPL